MFKKWFKKKETEIEESEINEDQLIETLEPEAVEDVATAEEAEGAEQVETVVEEVEIVVEAEAVEEVETVEEAPVVEEAEFIEETLSVEETETAEETEIATSENVDGFEEEMNTEKQGGFFSKLIKGLDKTRKNITDKIDNLVNNYGEIDDELFDELEEILITADIGMTTTMRLIEELRAELIKRKITDVNMVKHVLRDVMALNLNTVEETKLNLDPPSVILVIGVNGAGKTTSIGKIANLIKSEGKSVLLAAADTFRAGAIEQLIVWGERSGIEVIAQSEGSDPAAVVFDAVQAAKARKTDVLICDTAGRLHNKVNLMNELNKIFRIIDREYPGANREVLLVLDATTGQNALQQAKLFQETAPITGVVLTKLDGTAKGGFVFAIKSELGIPVKLIGVGEGINDLQHFDPEAFSDALMEN
jgi:fused signal recognition particle receptor